MPKSYRKSTNLNQKRASTTLEETKQHVDEKEYPIQDLDFLFDNEATEEMSIEQSSKDTNKRASSISSSLNMENKYLKEDLEKLNALCADLIHMSKETKEQKTTESKNEMSMSPLVQTPKTHNKFLKVPMTAT